MHSAVNVFIDSHELENGGSFVDLHMLFDQKCRVKRRGLQKDHTYELIRLNT